MTDTPVSDPFFVIFDTCTHAAYYGDVHEVLALPAGAIVRYEYKRYLFKPEAAATLDGFANAPVFVGVVWVYFLPIVVLFRLGQFERKDAIFKSFDSMPKRLHVIE